MLLNNRIIYAPGKSSQADLAADAGPFILRELEKYFNIPYPLPKTDMVALPDFKYGAMENWGLITYRETALLYERGVSSLSNRERVIEVCQYCLHISWNTVYTILYDIFSDLSAYLVKFCQILEGKK